MRYKLFGILAAVGMLALAFTAAAFGREGSVGRVHQHRIARGPSAGCDCDGGELCTHLPLVLIHTGGVEIPGVPIEEMEHPNDPVKFTTTAQGERMLSVSVAILDDPSRNHHPSDQPDLESSALIRVRGNSSRYFDKKGYLLRFTDQEGRYADRDVMGMDAHYEWALHGPFLDKTLMRNYMWYNIAGEMMGYAPNVRFCELILNGEYQGLYVMTETLTNGEECRLNISEPVEGTTSTGYLLRLDNGSEEEKKNIYNFTYYTYRLARSQSQKINIVYPKSGDLTQELADAIEQDFSDFEKALYSFDYDTAAYGYQQYIDVSSFVDFFIFTEFTCNYDVGARSTYLYRDLGGKYKMAVWDCNSVCDNYWDPMLEPQDFQLPQIVWYFMLLKDEAFTERIIERYRELRQGILSEEYLNQYMDEVIAYLGPAVERNFSVWGDSLKQDIIKPASRNPHSFEEATAQMRGFIHERGEWMDQYIETIRQYSHPSVNKRYNH